MRGVASRKLAVEVLIKVEQDGAFAGQALAKAFKDHSLSERDRAFVTYIVQGTLRHQAELDEQISKFSKIKLERLSLPVKIVLRSGIYQLLHVDEMPPSAVINTSVEIAKKTGHEGSAKFVNAVLRSVERARQGGACQPGEAGEDNLSRRYSLPDWLIKRWSLRFGEEETLKLLEFSQKVPELILRVCTTAISTEGLLAIFGNKGIKAHVSKLMHSCLIVSDRGPVGGPVNKLPGYADGLFTVQDDVSALVSFALSPRPGQTVVDLCAAPGGKSFHLAELMENKGRVIAVDISERRLSLLGKERRRLGLTNIETVVEDGVKFKPEQPVDAVLLDAPCSGSGVLNRRADLRVRRTESDIDSLVTVQRSLLENAAAMLKPEGILVYSTCSIEEEENESNIVWFLEKHPEFRSESLASYFPEETLAAWSREPHWDRTSKEIEAGRIQLLPSRHGCSGFYICRLRKLH